MNPLHLASGPAMLRRPFQPAASLRRLQERKLRRLIGHAYAHVAHYRETMDGLGLKPGDIRTLDDLRRLPLLDKIRLQSLPETAKTADNIDLGRCLRFTTSGTSGRPLTVYFTRRDFAVRNLNCARTYVAAGARPWDKIGLISGDLVVNNRKTLRQRAGLWRRHEVSSWLGPDVWIEEMLREKPDVLIGRVTTLSILGQALKDRGIDGLRPRLIISSAETLDPASREFFQETFGSRVVDHYGCFEAGCAAWECPRCGGYHLNADVLIVEVLGMDGHPVPPGESGEVVVTNLHSYAMPFIRYRQEDLVVPSARPSKCGRRFPLLDRLEGRRDDQIVRPDGRRIPAQSVYHVMIPVPAVRRWQVVQESVERVVVRVEPLPGFGIEAERILVETMQTLIGKDIRVEVVQVDKIETDPNKKTRVVTSLIR
ncbi:MAG: phenylacetate--CoA ligase family protein [Candidatus Aminicenantes bacterium]|nr:phenylacetate--CoA ligase family protein [Candidatus Aminicenantes bacterium]